jgi:hypothetical protein
MPIYELALKDGRKFDVEGPEGATDAQLAALLNQQLSAPATDSVDPIDQQMQENLAAAEARTKAAQDEFRRVQESDASFGESLADIGIGVQRGTLTIVDAAIDAFGGASSDASKFMKRADKHLAALLSAEGQADAERAAQIIADAEGKGIKEELIAGLQAVAADPSGIISQAGGSAIPFIATSLLGTPALVGLGAVTGAGIVKGGVYDAVESELLKEGVDPERAAAAAEQAQAYGGENIDQILLGTLLGAGAAVGPLERILVKKLSGNIAARLAKGTVAEAIPESIQAGQEKFAQNLALQREGFDVDLGAGVAAQASMEGFAAAPLGGIAGIPRGPETPTTPPPSTPPAEPAPVVDDRGPGEVAAEELLARLRPEGATTTEAEPEAPPAGQTTAEEMLAKLRPESTVADAEVGAAKQDADSADALLDATQAEYNARISELVVDQNLSPEEAELQVAEAQPELKAKLDNAIAGVEEARVRTKEAEKKITAEKTAEEAARVSDLEALLEQERSQQEQDAEAQREQPKTTETTIERTTPEGETTVETTRTQTARGVLAEQQSVKEEQDKRRELLNDPKKLAEYAEETGQTVEEAQALLEQNVVDNLAREGELDDVVNSPEFKELQAEEKAKASKIKFKDTTDPNAEKAALGLAPEEETTPENQRIANIEGLVSYARQKKQVAASKYNTAAREARRLIQRLQPSLTPEQLDSEAASYLQESAEKVALDNATQDLDVLQTEAREGQQERLSQSGASLKRTNEIANRLRAEQKALGKDKSEQLENANVVPDALSEADTEVIDNARNGGYPDANDAKLNPYNALRIYASKSDRPEDVINYIAYDIVYPLSKKVKYEEGKAPAPVYTDQVAQPTISLAQVREHLGKPEGKISQKLQDQARRELGESEQYFEAREINRGLYHRPTALAAAKYLRQYGSKEVRNLLSERLAAWRRSRLTILAAYNNMNMDPDAFIKPNAAAEAVDHVEQRRIEDARLAAEEVVELNKETENLRKQLGAKTPVASKNERKNLLTSQLARGGFLEGLNDLAVAIVLNDTVKLAGEPSFADVVTIYGGDLAITRAFETDEIRDVIREQRALGRYKKVEAKDGQPLSRAERVEASEIDLIKEEDVIKELEQQKRDGEIDVAAFSDEQTDQLIKEARDTFGPIDDDFEAIEDVLADNGIEVYLEYNALMASEALVPPSVYQALKAGDLRLTLDLLQQSTPNKMLARTIRKFMENVGTTKIQLTPGLVDAKGKPVPGKFDPTTNTISINPDEGVTAHAIMHEMGHAITLDTIRNKPGSIHVKRLRTIYDSLKNRLSTAYGAQSLEEFVAEFKSNVEFRKEVARLTAKGQRVSAAREIIRAIRNLLRRVMGLEPKGSEATVAEIDTLIDSIIDPAPYSASGAPAYLNSDRGGVKKIFKHMAINQRRKASEKDRASLLDKILSFLGSPFRLFAQRTLLGAADLLTVSQIYEALGMGRTGFKVQRSIETQRARLVKSDQAVQDEVDNLAEWFDSVGPQAEARFNAVVYSSEFGATIFQIDPNKPRSEYAGKLAKDDVTDLGDVWDDLQRVWNQIGRDVGKGGVNGQQMFNRLRKFYSDQRKSMLEIIQATFKDIMPGDQDASVRQTLISRLLAEQDTLEVYFPLERVGKFMLSYNLDPNSVERGVEPYVVRFFETDKQRERAILELSNDPTVINESFSTDDSGSMEQVAKESPPSSFVNALLTALNNNPETSGEAGRALREQVLRTFVNALPQTAIARSLQKRKGTLGYEANSLLALKNRAFEFGRQVVRMQAVKELNAYQNTINNFALPTYQQVQALIERNPNSTLYDIARANNLTVEYMQRMIEIAGSRNPRRAQRKYHDSIRVVTRELNDRINFAREGARFKGAEEIAKTLNQSAFLFTIGFNVSSYLVNMSQVPLFAFPYLGADYGYTNAYGAIRKAMNQVGVFKNNIESYYTLDEQGNFAVMDTVTDARQRALLEELAPVVQEASGRGLLNQTYIADVIALGEQKNLLDTITGLSAFMFNHGERFNRQVTLMAIYQMAIERQKKLNDARPADRKLADSVVKKRAIEEAIEKTQMVNGGTVIETGMRYTNQNVGRVAGMYKGFGVRMYTTMFMALRDLLKGMYPGSDAETKRKRNVAFKQLVGLHGSAALFAGVYGIPIYGAIALAYNTFADEDEDDFDTVVRKAIGEFYFKGPLNELTGLDVASRVRLTGLVIQENRYNTNASPEENLLFYLGGPALSVGKRFARGVADLQEGNIERGIENMLPAAISNAYKAMPIGRYQKDDGIYTRRGDPIYADMTHGELAAQLLGFPPAEYTARQERNLRDKRIEKAVTTTRTKLLRKYYIAARAGDLDAMSDAIDEILDYNDRHPYAAIDGETLDKSMKQHIKASAEMFDGVSISPIMRDAINMSRMDYSFY